MNPPDRKRKQWLQDLPAFLDAASSVSSTTFGARRLPELKALWSQVRGHTSVVNRIDEPFQSAGHKTSTRHLRRRTTSHASRKRHRYPLGFPEDGLLPKVAITKMPSRKARRKPAILRNDHGGWQRNEENANNKVYWLPTHLWHAKRFHMQDMFGWRVPLQHTNRGSRAVRRLLREGRTTIQDITWRMQPIVICTNDLKILVESMTRLCPAFLPKSHLRDILDGRIFGAGVLHEVDAFPTKAIGPAMWWIRPIESNASVSHEMHLFLHPSIRPRVEEVLRDLSQISSLPAPTKLVGGIACFQLQGTSAVAAIVESLQIKEDDVQAVISARHFSVVRVAFRFGTNESWLSTSARPFDMSEDEIILVRHDENPGEFSGWHLFSTVSDAHNIFLALTRHAQMVAVGYAEETHVSLSLDPPTAIFPAAYPDSEQGKRYWEGSTVWKALRSACESGHGRIRATQHGDSVLMSKLLSLASPMDTPDENATALPVVVRGVFGQPFVDLLQQCARLQEKTPPEQSKHRRPRRKRIRRDVVRLACRVSDDEAQGRIGRVVSLASSLSLAALIRCKIQVYGRGTLEQGDSIYGCSRNDCDASSDPAKEIGVVVDGSFSGDHGFVQGYGFVSAARFLAFLVNCLHPNMMYNDGALSLIVELRRGTTSTICSGNLSLLL